MEDFNSKYSGQQVEDLLDQVANGNVSGGAKVYHFDLNTAVQIGAIGQEIYDTILAADIVMVNEIVAYKEVAEDGSISLYSSVTANSNLDDPSQLTSVAIGCIIGSDLSVTTQVGQALIPTKTSELTNDSGFITAEESPKIYHMATLAGESGTISQEVYDAILAADVVVYSDRVANVFKNSDGGCTISYIYTFGATVINDRIYIAEDLNYTFTQLYYIIPTATSELTNDSNFITAADIPPSGGLPTEVIELSSEITLLEGKMLEINLSTPVTGALAVRNPVITDPTQGLLSGIRFYCGESLPQLSFTGLFGFIGVWANGELPQLEPNSVIEILAVRATGGAMFLLTWAIYKA